MQSLQISGAKLGLFTLNSVIVAQFHQLVILANPNLQDFESTKTFFGLATPLILPCERFLPLKRAEVAILLKVTEVFLTECKNIRLNLVCGSKLDLIFHLNSTNVYRLGQHA